MIDLKWSGAEKKIARRAYEAARQQALAGVLAEFKARAAAAATVDEMWDVGDFLRSRRRALEDLLDYRYSRLPLVLARLVLEGHLDMALLNGFSDEKLEIIRTFMIDMAANDER